MDKLIEAGPDLDARVAHMVMGWMVGPLSTHGPRCGEYVPHLVVFTEFGKVHLELHRPLNNEVQGWSYGELWRPSKDIAAAWEVLEKLPTLCVLERIPGGWSVYRGHCDYEDGISCGDADTLPLAICLAALKVVNA